MLVVSLAIAVLLLFAAVATAKIAKSTLADRTIRRGWFAYCAALVIVVVLELVFYLLDSIGNSFIVRELVVVVLCAVVASSVYLLQKTIHYLTEVNSIKGINIHDPVSGVFNRLYVEQRLDTEVARSHRYGSPLALVLVEIRGFLQLNDEYGHQVSAIANSRLARRLTSLLRETDIVASHSAGRFILLLPDTPESTLPGLINRLRSAIDGMVVVDGAGLENSVKLFVRFGTSFCELKTRNGQELIQKAISELTDETMIESSSVPGNVETIYRHMAYTQSI